MSWGWFDSKASSHYWGDFHCRGKILMNMTFICCGKCCMCHMSPMIQFRIIRTRVLWHIDRLMLERRNFSALQMELCLSCINPLYLAQGIYALRRHHLIIPPLHRRWNGGILDSPRCLSIRLSVPPSVCRQGFRNFWKNYWLNSFYTWYLPLWGESLDPYSYTCS